MRAARGAVALRSTVDPQAATIRSRSGRVHVERGVADDADVTVAVDVLRMREPDAPRPKVSGALVHPRLALTAAKVLDPPADPWPLEAERFWAFASTRPGAPAGLRVVSTDDGRVASFGASPAPYEIHGPAHRLTVLFTGGSVLGQDLLDGRLHAVGSLAHLAELTGCTVDWMLGR
jgi:hypothetical protein